MWPAVQLEYGRLRATPGPIALLLIALGLGGLIARRRLDPPRPPRLLGIVEPRALRYRKRLGALLERNGIR